jgi:16S rRNA (cytidine1402-2'-O)-methyltransferase
MNQKSYEKSEHGKLYLIPTPVGNLSDISYRAIETFKLVDIVYAEDTRETFNLLKYYDINKRIESCHKFSEMKHKNKIIDYLKSGKNIGYCTDRGTPLISDPGNIIVDEAIKNGISVIALPGANALLPAINMSGLSNQRFLFYGFLNSKKSIAKKELIDLKNIKQTLIFYESPFRIVDTLKILLEVFGNRKASVVREISKLHEEVLRNNIENLIFDCQNIKGEIVIVVEGNNDIIVDDNNYEEIINNLIKKGMTKKDAIKEVVNKYGVSKNKLYNLVKEK